jgi:hypothetical protein
VHARGLERQRGSAHARGYTRHWRESFKPWFIDLLIAADIAPVCGASLPQGPAMTYSLCKADGLLTFTNPDGSALHLHHDPSLQPEERHDRRKVEDPARVGLLCLSCHSIATHGETATP